MSVWFLSGGSFFFFFSKTLGQHPGATSHPIRAFKLVNIVYRTTHFTPSNAQAKETETEKEQSGPVRVSSVPRSVVSSLPFKAVQQLPRKQHSSLLTSLIGFFLRSSQFHQGEGLRAEGWRIVVCLRLETLIPQSRARSHKLIRPRRACDKRTHYWTNNFNLFSLIANRSRSI